MVLDAGHVFEEFDDLAGFPGELGVVVEVLILAAAAFAKERAAGFGAFGRGLEDFEQIGSRVVLVVAEDADADFFAGEAKGDEDDPVLALGSVGVVIWNRDAGDAIAEVGEGIDGDFEFLMVFERMGMKFLRRAWHGRGLGEISELPSGK